jgi:serine protease AprX
MKAKTFLPALALALGTLAGAAHADEFTVGRSGADVAFNQGLTGQGIGVAVIDSGISSTHLDLLTNGLGTTSRVRASVNFVTGTTSTGDECGHGTHVGGIIAGNGANSIGSSYYRTFYGIARQANLISIKVLDKNGQGSVSQVIAGIQWAINNKAAYNIRVINLSVGHVTGESYTTDPLCQAAEAAWKAGIVVVTAAGNNGRKNTTQVIGQSNEGWGTNYGSITSPGNDPYVITVGAVKNFNGVRAQDRIGTYSSRGPSRLDSIMKPDIVAPGNQVIALCMDKSYLDTYAGNTNNIPNSIYKVNGDSKFSKNYFRLSGTSMAAPVVSGAVALMLQANPNLTPDSVKARLMISADKWANPDGSMDPCTFGAGYLNIPSALVNTAVATKPALSPKLFRDTAGNVQVSATNLFGTDQVIWGTSGLNNLQGIWGDQVIWGTKVIWGSQVLWGDATWTDQVIWGTSSSKVDLTNTAIRGEN